MNVVEKEGSHPSTKAIGQALIWFGVRREGYRMAAPAKHQEAPTFGVRSVTSAVSLSPADTTAATPTEPNDLPLANPLDFVSTANTVSPALVPALSPSLSRVSSFSDTQSHTFQTFETLASSLGYTLDEIDEPLSLNENEETPVPHAEAISDAELVAALHSLNLLSDNDTNQDDPLIDWYQPLALPDGSHELPDLEFLDTEGDTLSVAEFDVWNVFESAASSVVAQTPETDTVDLLHQLEGLSLKPTVQGDETETQSQSSWLDDQPLALLDLPWHTDPMVSRIDEPDAIVYCQPCNDPQSVPPPAPYVSDEERLLLQQVQDAEYWQQQWRVLTSGGMPSSLSSGLLSSSHPSDPPMDEPYRDSFLNEEDYFCQPCHDPNSIPPIPYSHLLPYSSQEQTWALAAAAVFAEQWEQEQPSAPVDPTDESLEPVPYRVAPHHPTDVSLPDPFELFQDHDLVHETVQVPRGVEPVTAHQHVLSVSNVTAPWPETEPDPVEAHGPPMVRPGARLAAEPFVESFGATFGAVDEVQTPSSTASRPPRRIAQRECFGHKERVLGCDVSHCGRFLATASQDSTIRIWNMATNRELGVLRGHSTEHECLRVAWASPQWAHDQVRRSTRTAGAESQVPTYSYLVASGGADGVVHLWGCNDPETEPWSIYATVDHAALRHFVARSTATITGLQPANGSDATPAPLDDDRPQIYSLQFIDHWQGLPSRSMPLGDDSGGVQGDKTTNYGNSFLLTSSDEYVHLWELDDTKLGKKTKSATGAVSKQLYFREVLSLRFGNLNGPAYGVTLSPVTEECFFAHAELQNPLHPTPTESVSFDNTFRFGGERNAKNVIFVFDASYCPANGLLGAALSDGTLRLVNGRGVCLSVLQLPGCQSHLTSFSWDTTGEKLATTVATGHLITWGIQLIHSAHQLQGENETSGATATTASGIRATCRAVMQGGHARGRPLYGSHFVGPDLLLSWGSDGRVCLWDSLACDDEIDEPLAVLWDNGRDRNGPTRRASDEGYPVFAVSVTPTTVEHVATSDTSEPDEHRGKLSIAVAGGGSEGGFLGIPVYVQDVLGVPSDEDRVVQGNTKRVKQEADN